MSNAAEEAYANVEPCGCDESNQAVAILQSLVEYERETDPEHDSEDCGDCIRCCAEGLLAVLEKKRAQLRKHVCGSCEGDKKG